MEERRKPVGRKRVGARIVPEPDAVEGCRSEEKDGSGKVFTLGAHGKAQGQGDESGEQAEPPEEDIVVGGMRNGVADFTRRGLAAEEIDSGGSGRICGAKGRAGAVAK